MVNWPLLRHAVLNSIHLDRLLILCLVCFLSLLSVPLISSQGLTLHLYHLNYGIRPWSWQRWLAWYQIKPAVPTQPLDTSLWIRPFEYHWQAKAWKSMPDFECGQLTANSEMYYSWSVFHWLPFSPSAHLPCLLNSPGSWRSSSYVHYDLSKDGLTYLGD